MSAISIIGLLNRTRMEHTAGLSVGIAFAIAQKFGKALN
jgi:hypothetical protein